MKEHRIVFAGDSTTDADKLATPDRLGTGYVRLVHDALVAFHPQGRYCIVNAGISGNTSAQLLERWERDVLQEKPDILFCMIGINDVWRQFDSYDALPPAFSEDAYEQHLTAMCERAADVRTLILMPPFFMERSRSDEMRVMTERYAARMRAVAHKTGRELLELQPAFDAYMKARSGLSVSWDRVHPGRIGSMLIAREVYARLAKEFS